MFDLTGMTALVTGASGGIGSAIAKGLAAQGARLAVSGSNAEKLETFRAGLGGDHVALACNLSDAAAVDALVPQAVAALGQLDILVNNAGITRDNLAMRMKDEEWSDVLRINLEAAFRLARAALKPMMRARFGRIVSVTSIVGATGNPGQANYAASKVGRAAAGHHRPHPRRRPRHRRGHRRRRRLPGQPRGRLRDRPDLACERRNGDDLKGLERGNGCAEPACSSSRRWPPLLRCTRSPRPPGRRSSAFTAGRRPPTSRSPGK
jgi:hypothetical protein